MKESKFYKWLDAQDDYGICNPPMEPQVAIDMLIDYLSEDDYITAMPYGSKQVNPEFVYRVLMKYSKKFRKETKERRKSKCS